MLTAELFNESVIASAAAADKSVGLFIEPDAIHIMKKSEYSGKYGDYSSYSEEMEETNEAPEEVAE